MKQYLLLQIWLFFSVVSCSNNDLSPQKEFVKARVMYPSCGGTVLQFIDSTRAIGKEWLWFKNLNGPFDASNPGQVYSRCVSAFELPKDRQIIGDTLEFTYDQIPNPPGSICTIGGLPTTYTSIKHLNP